MRHTALLLIARVPLIAFTSHAAIAAHHPDLRLSPRATSVPAPIVIPSSQNWQGNDGPWSTFTLQVGTPAQDLDVLVSTAAFQTWVVLPQACTSSDPLDCSTLRGNEFLPNKSTTWVQNNQSTNGLFVTALENNLGYSANASFGYDTVVLGWQGSGGPSLSQQIVAGIATPEFYLGLFGLNPRPSNFTSFDDPVPSYMQNLKNRSMIPSLSWSYTAGNQYRLNKVLGNLILGGYDTSRFEPNDLTFAFNEEDIRDLTVDIEAITFTAGSTNTTLSSTTVAAFVDSTVPYIFLPLNVCQSFEAAFGITWDDDVQAYLVNDTLHAKLLAQNANVTFTLGNATAGKTVDITLPYAAFDLTADYPLVENATLYFPLMRATNDTQYTLGRAFLQEAYLTADYERRNFSISQCSWNANSVQHVVAITSPANQTSSTSHHLSAGDIAGASIGGIVLLLGLLALLYFFVYQPRRNKRRGSDKKEPLSSDDHIHNLKSELDARDTNKPGYEVDAVQQAKTELEVREAQSPGSELDAKHTQSPGYEMDGKQYFGAELDGRINSPIYELPAREEPAGEMPSPDSVATPRSPASPLGPFSPISPNTPRITLSPS